MVRRLPVLAAAFSFLSACTTHPLPDEVTGVSTYDIVRQVRCETREAIRKNIINWLANLGEDHEYQRGVPLARDLALRYERDPNAINNFGPSLFKEDKYDQVRAVINLLYSIGIAYNFDLTMTEENNLSSGSTNFKRSYSHTVFTLGLGGGAANKRSNNRTFTVTDTFGYLITNMNSAVVSGRRYCDGFVVGTNHIYPIAGRIGVEKLVYDFLNLTLFTGLASPKTEAGGNGPPTIADKLTFTTSFEFSATPKIVFTPTTPAFQFTDAAITAGLKRTDAHQVTVGLAVPTNANVYLNSLRSYLFSSGRGTGTAERSQMSQGRSSATTLIVGARVIGGGTPAEALAVVAIDQLKARELEIIPSP